MSNIELSGLFLNLILYIIIIFPVIIISRKKNITKNKKTFIKFLIISTVIEILFSLFIYSYSRNFFSIFTETTGIINFATHCSKILFICSPLYGFKILVPSLLKNKNAKKTVILVASKITANILFAIIGFFIFNFKGFLYSFPICDFIFYIICIIIFIKYIKNY